MKTRSKFASGVGCVDYSYVQSELSNITGVPLHLLIIYVLPQEMGNRTWWVTKLLVE